MWHIDMAIWAAQITSRQKNRAGDLARKVQQGHLLQAADHFIASGWIALYDQYT